MRTTPEGNGTAGVRSRLVMVIVYAVAMAWVEAAVVLDLRTLIGQYNPALPARGEMSRHLLLAECIREAATLTMLFAVGWLAGRSWRSRLGAGVMAFGLWDIGYYLFLVPLTGWPTSPADWDILFLLPLPWWGPVWAPASIAVLMILGGGTVFLCDTPETPCWPRPWAVTAAGVGAGLALLVFMSEALRALPTDEAPPLGRMPAEFETLAFLAALSLMAVPVVELALRGRCPHRTPPPSSARDFLPATDPE
ncbi:MAG: hypothetical protein H7A45_07355 [Verrucomicrobiales bacterium]|nr:hypothetical protein [Verrucomicrobiales bacterium]MCP5528274.1 hypothetical protein [Verrucomicrobiales bacterium]